MIPILISFFLSIGGDINSDIAYINDVKIKAVQSEKEISIQINSANFDKFREIVIERSTSPSSGFRPIKIMGNEFLSNVQNNELLCRDEHPLGQQVISYYRVRVNITDETMKIFPPIRVESYQDRVLSERKTPEKVSKKTEEEGPVELLMEVEQADSN